MDREEEEATAADRWQGSLNATCNRLCNQYLTMLKAASGMSTANTISSSGLRH